VGYVMLVHYLQVRLVRMPRMALMLAPYLGCAKSRALFLFANPAIHGIRWPPSQGGLGTAWS
jgi:hypothetical protein